MSPLVGVVQSLSRVRLLRPHGRQPTRLLCPWDLPSKNIGVGCYFHLQEMLLLLMTKKKMLRLPKQRFLSLLKVDNECLPLRSLYSPHDYLRGATTDTLGFQKRNVCIISSFPVLSSSTRVVLRLQKSIRVTCRVCRNYRFLCLTRGVMIQPSENLYSQQAPI